MFIHKKINFNNIKLPVLPLWHAPYDKENVHGSIRISSFLNSNHVVQNRLMKPKENVLRVVASRDPNDFNICFGVQCVIQHDFLVKLENKYKITNLANAINCRADRCCLERIMGVLFNQECPQLYNIKSLFGNIYQHYRAFKYNYNEYNDDFKHNRLKGDMVKVWTGR